MQAVAMADDSTTMLCTHNEHTSAFNTKILDKLYSTSRQKCGMLSTVGANTELYDWLAEPNFHQMTAVAPGCRVMLLHHRDISKGAVNGATGRVTHVVTGPPPPQTTLL